MVLGLIHAQRLLTALTRVSANPVRTIAKAVAVVCGAQAVRLLPRLRLTDVVMDQRVAAWMRIAQTNLSARQAKAIAKGIAMERGAQRTPAGCLVFF